MIDYSNIKKLIHEADAIVIGAGAGLSTSAGLDYGEKNFKEHFPELVEKYHMTDMYTSSFYPFKTEEEKWSYWAKHIDYLYNVEAKETYQKLYHLVKDKNYFVITTNVDGQFLKAGFDPHKVFEVQGSLAKIQCAVACHQKCYDDLPLVKEMLQKDKNCQIPTSLVPKCPRCQENMEVNLRKDAYFVEDDHWHELNQSYERFLNDNKEKNLLLIELGVGFNTPSIIRFPFEKMASAWEKTHLIRINEKNIDPVLEITEKSLLIKEDCHQWITKILEQ